MSDIIHARVAGRLFRITLTREDLGLLVDVRDVRSTFETQAIMREGMDCEYVPQEIVLADSEVRDAISSTYYNATSHESGKFPVGGTRLPDNFTIEKV